jgi:GxxExxY protein
MGENSRTSEPHEWLDELAAIVVDAAHEVHRTLGPGFPEVVYEEALATELGLRGTAFQRQVPVRVKYKGVDVGEGRLDMLVGRHLIVELKVVEGLAQVHVAQVISYLKATGLSLALLITFNVRHLKQGLRRIVLSR